MLHRIARIGFVTAIFATGFFAGSIVQRPAEAQQTDWKGLAGDAVKQAAGQQGGMIGTIAQLGTAIVDMEKQVSGLQKNIDVLKNVKKTLGG